MSKIRRDTVELAVKKAFLLGFDKGHEQGYRDGYDDGYECGQGCGPGHRYDNNEEWVQMKTATRQLNGYHGYQ